MIQTLTDFIQSIFGIYNPIPILDSNSEVIDYSPDIGYISAVVIFCICLYMLLKTIGGVIYEWLRR